MNSTPQHVLVIKPSSLGDIIHTLPAVSALRRRFPRAHFTWLVKKVWGPILEGNPDIDEILPVDFSLRSWPGLLQTLRRGKWDLVVDFQGLLRSGIISVLSGASVRLGFDRAREGARYCYTDPVSLPGLGSASWRLGEVHAVDRNLALAGYLGAETANPVWHLPDRDEDRHYVQRILHANQVDEREHNLVVIAPWSRSSIKCWPLPRFVELVNKLVERKTIRPVLIGAGYDEEAAKPFMALESQGLINLVGRLTLPQLPVFLRRVKGVVGNDSAPLHMAAGLGIPVLALHGPTHPKVTGPYPLANHLVMSTGLPCSPCGRNECFNPDYRLCLKSLDTDAVFAKLFDLVGRGMPSKLSADLADGGRAPKLRILK